MTVEREIAGLVLPFVIGIAAATYAGIPFHDHFFINASLSMTGVLICTAIFMTSAKTNDGMTRIIIAALALSAGLFCGFNGKILSVSHTQGIFISKAAELGKEMQDIIDRISFTDKTCNAIAKALITGERCDIRKDISEAFRLSGASHILALSGLHLGIIYAVITKIFSILGNTRQAIMARSGMTIIFCGLYTMATGAGASITRAFLFILLAETARLTQRKSSTGQILFSALLIQLTLSASSIKSVGFQLSYAAMAGIAFVLPHMKAWWPGDIHHDDRFTRYMRKIWNAAAMSISCQLTTFPLAWIYFGTFPKHFLLTNLIALPLTGAVIPSIICTIMLQSLGICPESVIQMTEFLITSLVRSLKVIAGM